MHCKFIPSFFITTAVCGLLSSLVLAGHEHIANSPAGIMRAHIHKQGQTMLMYNRNSVNTMGVEGLESEALASYHEVPSSMLMAMDMIGVMHGVTQNVTLSAMASYMTMKMESHSDEVGTQNHSVLGLGDLQLDSMYRIFTNHTHHLQANLGVIVPTGNIDSTHTMYANHGAGLHSHTARNSYNMQLGTGSYSLTPGVSYINSFAKMWQFGSQLNAVVRLNNNNNGYRFGNIYNVTAWVNHDINKIFSVSSRLDFTKVETVHGKDFNIDEEMSPMNVVALLYRNQGSVFIGGNANLYGKFAGTRISFEVGTPFYQRIGNGNLQQKVIVNFSLQYMF